MPQILTSTRAVEGSTIAFVATFRDEDDALVTPSSITWTLSDDSGTTINSRLQVGISAASSVMIVLTGDDLALQTGESGAVTRLLTIEAVYDSNIGNNLKLKEELTFTLLDLKAIS